MLFLFSGQWDFFKDLTFPITQALLLLFFSNYVP